MPCVTEQKRTGVCTSKCVRASAARAAEHSTYFNWHYTLWKTETGLYEPILLLQQILARKHYKNSTESSVKFLALIQYLFLYLPEWFCKPGKFCRTSNACLYKLFLMYLCTIAHNRLCRLRMSILSQGHNGASVIHSDSVANNSAVLFLGTETSACWDFGPLCKLYHDKNFRVVQKVQLTLLIICSLWPILLRLILWICTL